MSSSTFFLVCLQAFLIQTAFSQVFGPRSCNGAGSVGLGNVGVSGLGFNNGLGLNNVGISGLGLGNGYFGGAGVQDVTAVASLPITGPYGGTGFGQIVVEGGLDAGGNAIVTGQVPVVGSVSVGGNIPASGVVSVAGNCACGGLVL